METEQFGVGFKSLGSHDTKCFNVETTHHCLSAHFVQIIQRVATWHCGNVFYNINFKVRGEDKPLRSCNCYDDSHCVGWDNTIMGLCLSSSVL